MEQISTIAMMLGLGLGIVAVLALWYNRVQRMNERNDHLRTALAESLAAIREQGAAMSDLKSASIRATEMDELFKEDHRAVRNGQVEIVERLPGAVEGLVESQNEISTRVGMVQECCSGILGRLASYKEEFDVGSEVLSAQTGGFQQSITEGLRTLSSQIQGLAHDSEVQDQQISQVTQGLSATISMIDSNHETVLELLTNITRKLREDY
jgi:hypothetical protein